MGLSKYQIRRSLCISPDLECVCKRVLFLHYEIFAVWVFMVSITIILILGCTSVIVENYCLQGIHSNRTITVVMIKFSPNRAKGVYLYKPKLFKRFGQNISKEKKNTSRSTLSKKINKPKRACVYGWPHLLLYTALRLNLNFQRKKPPCLVKIECENRHHRLYALYSTSARSQRAITRKTLPLCLQGSTPGKMPACTHRASSRPGCPSISGRQIAGTAWKA